MATKICLDPKNYDAYEKSRRISLRTRSVQEIEAMVFVSKWWSTSTNPKKIYPEPLLFVYYHFVNKKNLNVQF